MAAARRPNCEVRAVIFRHCPCRVQALLYTFFFFHVCQRDRPRAAEAQIITLQVPLLKLADEVASPLRIPLAAGA